VFGTHRPVSPYILACLYAYGCTLHDCVHAPMKNRMTLHHRNDYGRLRIDRKATQTNQKYMIYKDVER
jgi:hypothetical protein